MNETTRRIIDLLDAHAAPYRMIEHEPTPTSADSARVRGQALSVGGKAIVMKVGDELRLFVLRADRRIDAAALKRRFDVKKLRFATAEELLAATGLVPGSVPPFGRPVLPFDLCVDRGIADDGDTVAFNAGSLTTSIVMASADYLRVAGGEICEFAQVNPGA